MKFKDLQALPVEKQKEKIREIELELMKEFGQIRAGTPAKNPGKISQMRRDIAKLKSILGGNQ